MTKQLRAHTPTWYGGELLYVSVRTDAPLFSESEDGLGDRMF